MADIKTLLGRLGMSEYLARFCAEGFDTWEIIMDIAETDLNSLAVTPTHQKLLQHEISKARTHLELHQCRLSAQHRSSISVSIHQSVPAEKDRHETSLEKKKRAYRRHPKADSNGPKHPLSAYMLFANDVRKNLQYKQLSFTQMARQVGESWQLFGNAELSEWKLRAASARELYLQDLGEYKQTREYEEYQRYLLDFKLTSSSSHLRPRRQLISQDAPRSTDSDRILSATCGERLSGQKLSACLNLQTQHDIKPVAATYQTKLLAAHDSKSTHRLLPDSPPGSTPQSLPRTFYITTAHSHLEVTVPLPLPHLSTGTETKTTTTTEPPLPDLGLGLRLEPGPGLESAPSPPSALTSASQQAQVHAYPYAYPFLPRRGYFETVMQSQVDELSQEVPGLF